MLTGRGKLSKPEAKRKVACLFFPLSFSVKKKKVTKMKEGSGTDSPSQDSQRFTRRAQRTRQS